ncbi:MAG: hypothetical protein ACOYXC_19365 [Candidatus Rifleibacteriota bacterium]
MNLKKLTRSFLAIIMILVFAQGAWASDSLADFSASVPQFKAQVRILDLTLGKIDGNHRVTHMIAEIVNISEPTLSENGEDNEVKEAFEFIQKNAKQVTIMVTPEAEKEGKLLGFFHPFVNGIHKCGLFKANTTIKAMKIEGLDGWQFVLTECHLLDQ